MVCRSAFRRHHEPEHRAYDHGFRVMLVVSPPASFRTESGAKDKPASPAIAPFTDADVQRIAALPAAEQVEEVRKELMRRNPGFDGKMEHKIAGGVVTEFRIATDKVTDIAPIRVFNALRVLECSGTNSRPKAQLEDLTPLKGMNLAGLTLLAIANTKVTDAGMVYFKDCKNLTDLCIYNTQVGDAGLFHFKDCKALTHLNLAGTQVSDAGLAHFKDCKDLIYLYVDRTGAGDAGLGHFKDCKNLTSFNVSHTRVSNAGLMLFQDCKALTHLYLAGTNVCDAGLAHFKDCKNLTELRIDNTQVGDAGLIHFKDCKALTHLNLAGTNVSDAGLAHFKGMPLMALWIYSTRITDLSPLQGMPLEDIRLTPKNITRGMDILRDMKSLKTIGINWDQAWPAAEFWQRYDRGEFKE
jgi:uncharacterized membrane protein